ncbi:RNA polymerase, sigma subunit, ECF family [Cognatiyoonia sediminum]|uniref:RNA polymerase, sigma subunit, ECF family n=1 Tax=Cognatiyoonia sediminum TaxID=1508389 RepID=A0A1M5N445_9RHOB|nr:RNA polymerase sigma factor [Cognatiyoonia sediminum]SHG84212.1 RNA polymerase, sigma subunit, ECF family [Cognatiyoonia sediminum]
MSPSLSPERIIERTIREERGRILASLVGSLNDLHLAEDCLQDAVLSAMSHWQRNGLPRSPAGWLITVARRKALDKLRRDQVFSKKQAEIALLLELESRNLDEVMFDAIPDSRLELIFICCHPSLDTKSQVALTLRALGGLSTEEIASAFLDTPQAMQQRITRAKRKIAQEKIPFVVPERSELPERTKTVLSVIYLIFNEGYSATQGASAHRKDLTDEAIRLARILMGLLPNDTEVAGLLALMLLHDSRRVARTDHDGNLVPLKEQNRKRWNQSKIVEGTEILERVLPLKRIGPYQLQAAISGVHAMSKTWEQTDWSEIAALYDLLFDIQPSPVVRINQAVAISYASSPEDGLKLLRDVSEVAKIQKYQPYFAALGDLQERAGQITQARENYLQAVNLSENAAEQEFLNAKIAQLGG